eukprot:COSAG06_NODE_6280_length_3001_cov_2.106134_2_plen_240_part_00
MIYYLIGLVKYAKCEMKTLVCCTYYAHDSIHQLCQESISWARRARSCGPAYTRPSVLTRLPQPQPHHRPSSAALYPAALQPSPHETPAMPTDRLIPPHSSIPAKFEQKVHCDASAGSPEHVLVNQRAEWPTLADEHACVCLERNQTQGVPLEKRQDRYHRPLPRAFCDQLADTAHKPSADCLDLNREHSVRNWLCRPVDKDSPNETRQYSCRFTVISQSTQRQTRKHALVCIETAVWSS